MKYTIEQITCGQSFKGYNFTSSVEIFDPNSPRSTWQSYCIICGVRINTTAPLVIRFLNWILRV